MRITKFGHACIRIEHDGHTIVVDPGGFTQLSPQANTIDQNRIEHLSRESLPSRLRLDRDACRTCQSLS